MCLIYRMIYEFNNWEAFYEAVEFVGTRHAENYPEFKVGVPFLNIEDSGWESLGSLSHALRHLEPDDLKEMSIHGFISFTVNRNENRNIIDET